MTGRSGSCRLWHNIHATVSHSCLVEFRVGVWKLALHVLSCCGSVRSRVCSGHTLFCPHGLCFSCSMRFMFSHVLFCCLVLLHTACVFIGCMHSCYVFCCVARSLCFSLAAYFHVVMSCVNTWLMSILINCVFMSCFAHGHVLVFLCGFCLVCMLPCVLMS